MILRIVEIKGEHGTLPSLLNVLPDDFNIPKDRKYWKTREGHAPYYFDMVMKK